MKVPFDKLSPDQQAILAGLPVTIESYTTAFDILVRRGLIDEETTENTEAGCALVDDAKARGYLRFVDGEWRRPPFCDICRSYHGLEKIHACE